MTMPRGEMPLAGKGTLVPLQEALGFFSGCRAMRVSAVCLQTSLQHPSAPQPGQEVPEGSSHILQQAVRTAA